MNPQHSQGLHEETEALRQRMLAVLQRVEAAAHAAGRDPASIRIMLATKAQSPEMIDVALRLSRELYGYSLAAESRVEALLPYDIIAAKPDELHFIGHLQTNKVGRALGQVDLLQTVDSLRLVEVLDRRLIAVQESLNVFIQVNVSAEESKNGVSLDQFWPLVKAVAATETLDLQGFMTIGLNSMDESAVRAGYSTLRQLRDTTLASKIVGTSDAGELSMGMSRDLELAIAEGATIIRVGTAIFGERKS